MFLLCSHQGDRFWEKFPTLYSAESWVTSQLEQYFYSDKHTKKIVLTLHCAKDAVN